MPPKKRGLTPQSVPKLGSGSTPEAFKDVYERHQLVFVKGCVNGRAAARPSVGLATLQRLYVQHPRMVEKTFCIENSTKSTTSAASVFNSSRTCSAPWYASFLIQKNRVALKAFLKALPMDAPPFLTCGDSGDRKSGDAMKHCDAMWVFVGRNSGKRPFRGRPEHTDAIDRAGTWHLQLRGVKVWKLRPTEELMKMNPSLRAFGCLKVTCQVGDVLCINTRLWWHHTYLPAGCGLSMSVAREWNRAGSTAKAVDMTNVEGHFATQPIAKGTLVMRENEMPNMELPRDRLPNCEVGELPDGTLALVAKRAIGKGEWFSLAPSDSEEEPSAEPPSQKRRRAN